MRRYKKLIRPESHRDHSWGTIPLAQLAINYRIPLERLHCAVQGGYLKLVKDAKAFKDVEVELPSPSVMAWLKEMLKPLAMRPLLRMREVAEMLGMKRAELVEICQPDKRIRMHTDPAFGELITPKDLFYVLQHLPRWHGLPSFHRQRMIQFLTGEHIGKKMKYRVLPYSEQIERETRRIAHMNEPYRTLRAVAIFEAMRDARTIVECLKIYHERVKREEVQLAEESIKRLMKTL